MYLYAGVSVSMPDGSTCMYLCFEHRLTSEQHILSVLLPQVKPLRITSQLECNTSAASCPVVYNVSISVYAYAFSVIYVH